MRRWNDPGEPGDGHRLLVTRYLPRGVKKSDWTWDQWQPALGPSKELHAAAYGKGGRGNLTFHWDAYRARYLAEMRSQTALIDELARRVASGETITLLCSSACVRDERCHRSLLKGLIEKRIEAMEGIAVPNQDAKE